MQVQAWTPLIRTRDMKYPLYLSDFAADKTLGNISIGSWVYEESIAEYGYFPVLDSEMPTGDVVTEGAPAQGEDGKWYKTWTSRKFTKEEVAENLARKKDEVRQMASYVYSNDLSQGVTVDGDTFAVDLAEVSNLQTTLLAGSETDPLLIRKADYTILELPSTEAKALITKILAAREAVHQNFLAYVRSVNMVTVISKVPEVPQTFL